MGRLITYDGIVDDQLKDLFKSKAFQTGLIIGACTLQKDLVLRLCPTPSKEDDASKTGDGDKKIKVKKDSPQLEETWICQHAKQLQSTLPGGLDILGFYIAASPDYVSKLQADLRQVIFAIYKTIGKNQLFHSSERILLNLCTVTSKIVCRTFDISDYKSTANPADFKCKSGDTRWYRLRSDLAVDFQFPVPKKDSALSLKKQLHLALGSFFKSIESARVTIEGELRDPEELFDLSLESKKSKKKQTALPVSDWHNMDLFIPLDNNECPPPEKFACASMMVFRGCVHARAYVQGKVTVEEAIKALKHDIIRSTIARCEIHCEDLLLIDKEDEDPLVVHELPRRVFAPLPQGDVSVCYFQFHSDVAADSLEGFRHILGLELSEEEVDTSCEVSPPTSSLILPETVEERLSEFGDVQTPSSFNVYLPAIGLIGSVAIGLLAFLMYNYVL